MESVCFNDVITHSLTTREDNKELEWERENEDTKWTTVGL